MEKTTRRADLSRRAFILAGATVALAARPALFLAHGQPAGGSINFQVTGTQSPSVIFVHGFGCALEDWDAQVKALSSRFRCAALDLPGHGASAKPAQGSIANLAMSVNQVKAGLGPGGKILVGHSMGCRVIMEAYLQSPAGVVGLVMVDGSILGGDPDADVKRAKERAHADIDLLTQNIIRDSFLEGSDPVVRERMVTRAKKVDPRLREEIFVDMVRWDVTKARDALKQITVPVLALQSTYINKEFKRVPLEPGMRTPWIDAIVASVPKWQVKLVPKAGHFTMMDAAGTVSEEIGKFAAVATKGPRQ